MLPTLALRTRIAYVCVELHMDRDGQETKENDLLNSEDFNASFMA